VVVPLRHSSSFKILKVMGKLSMYNFITLNGFYKGAREDISWHQHGSEEMEYAEEGAQSGATLLFGRRTYDMMSSYWPTPQARQATPALAEAMNNAEKIVFSKSLKNAVWQNTTVVGGNIVREMKKLKKIKGKDMTILGSGSIVSLFAKNGLIDEYQIMVDPVSIPKGTPIFKGVRSHLNLNLVGTRTFKSGVVLLTYEPAKK
jgi:dihydrofolate reductase